MLKQNQQPLVYHIHAQEISKEDCTYGRVNANIGVLKAKGSLPNRLGALNF